MGIELPPRPATLLGRGGRSVVGETGFRMGGFILDRGDRDVTESERVERIAVPDDWRFVIVRPVGTLGRSGIDEAAAFRTVAPLGNAATDGLRAIARREIVPALRDQDLARFASATTRFNRVVGSRYAGTQGGLFSHPLVRRLDEAISAGGTSRLLQSSWGPTAAIPCESQIEAVDVVLRVRSILAAEAVVITVAAPLNRGAAISRETNG